MAKARSGFAIMFTGEDTITSDGNPYPAEFLQHQKATLRYLTTLQDCAETYLDNCKFIISCNFTSRTLIPDSNLSVYAWLSYFTYPKTLHSQALRFRWVLAKDQNQCKDNPERRVCCRATKVVACTHHIIGVHNWTINDLPDPESRYKSLAEGGTFSNHRINVPLVYDTTGKLIHPAEYRSKIPEGTLVVVRGVLKWYAQYLVASVA